MKTTRNLTFFAVVVIGLLLSCQVWGVKGDGNNKRETRTVSSFNSVEIGGAFDLTISQGTAQSVIVEADDNILPLIRTEVVGNTLKIDTKKPIHHASKMKIFLTVVDLKRIDASGAVNIQTENRLTVPELTISGSGASDGKMDLAVQKLNIDMSGSCNMHFSGTAENVSLDGSGAVNLHAFDLVAQNYNLDISGAGKAEINVAKELKADISGAANVYYKGEPTQMFQDVSGAGSIRKVN
ncbi:MAG: head GIN domain-containing protein [Bacteroidota bacterium]|nr:head GIN domain-containing protein [Bacteroidota bacterium]